MADAPSRNDVTVFMIVRDEERMLPRCLESLGGFVDEAVVLDTGSTDGTVALLEAETAGGRFARFRWESHEFRDFGSARQAALDLVTTEWALWMDADESLSPELRDRLLELKTSGRIADHTGYFLRRSNRVLGRVMTGCRLASNSILRLFRTRAGRLVEAKVHEGIRLEPDSTTTELPEPLYHEAMTSWSAYLRKVDQYTSLDVAGSERGFNPLHLLVAGPAVFLKQYVFRRGFRDGWPGYVWSVTSAWSVMLRDLKRLRKALGRQY